MKSSRSKTSKPTPEPEECGVWLDAAELRAKKRRKQLEQPISKFLNPLARSSGHSLAVTLNFTQTKMHMPATRQSTISSFFLPQSEMSKDQCSSPPPGAHTGIEQKCVSTPGSPESPLEKRMCTSLKSPQQEFDADIEETGEVNKCEKKQQHFFHLFWGCQYEEREPAEKRSRPTPEDDIFEDGNDTQKKRSKVIFHGCRTNEIQDIPETLLLSDQLQDSHYHDGKRKRESCSASVSEKDLQSQESMSACTTINQSLSLQRPILTARSVTENKHSVKHPLKFHKQPELSETNHRHTHCSPLKRKEKENCDPSSPTHSSEVSFLKPLISLSPAKSFSNFKKPDVFQKLKHYPALNLIKEHVESEPNSLDMLFTQDSEGFRVIANRPQQSRGALKDRTNSTESRDHRNLPSVKPWEAEEDSDVGPEMLFTQDSQGNMVIKH
ncbi:aurora kinase A- and ninein-interacting protein isoform X2 [Hoplias malabaricus]|uniref:aurora kinase A- and ninein-interacting protein isoform X2 n=1 Tax=Hoplias malabaricus TaxID=27720 RepID=UPI0034637191